MTQVYIEWIEKYSVENEVLDSQHRQIFQVINDLYSIRIGDLKRENLKNLLLKLEIFTQTHFQVEETYLKYASFPGIEDHKNYHSEMVNKTIEIAEEIRHGTGSSTDLLKVLKKWWVSHVCIEDQKYVNYVKKLEI